MTKRIISTVITALLVFTAAGYFLFAIPEKHHRKNPYLTRVRLRDINIEVRTSGTLEANKSHMISSQIKGTGARIIYLAPDGSFVDKGEVLVRFDPKPYEDATAKLSSQLEMLEAAVNAARQLVEWEKNEAGQKVVAAKHKNKIAKLDLTRISEGEGPLKLAQYKDDLNKADQELKHYRAYEHDLKQLEQEGVTSAIELARINEDLDLLKSRYNSAKRQFDSYQNYVLPVMIEGAKEKVKNSELLIQQMKQASVYKIARAQAKLQQAEEKLKGVRLALAKARDELDKTVITAPFDGLIIHYETFRNSELRVPREGDTAIIHQPLMYFPDISSFMVKSNVREIDLHRLKVKQRATITMDAYPGKVYNGELAFIGSLARKRTNSASDEKYFQVVFSLASADERLRPGMSARVIVHISEAKELPAVPVQCVFRDSGGEFCYLWNGMTHEKRHIVSGRYNEDYIEIKEGLKLGDAVSLIKPEHL